MSKNLFAFVVACLVFFSCQKSGEDGQVPLTKTEMLTNGSWKITEFDVDTSGDGSFEINVYALFESCNKDDFFIFKTNGTVDRDEGPSKCNESDPQVYSITWRFLENETKLEIDGDAYDIAELSNTTLSLIYTEPGYYAEKMKFVKR